MATSGSDILWARLNTLGVFTCSEATQAFTSCDQNISIDSHGPCEPLRWSKYVSLEALEDSDYPSKEECWINGLWFPDGAEVKTYTFPLFPDDPKKEFWNREGHFATKATHPADSVEITW
jgi:hypothetical protein